MPAHLSAQFVSRPVHYYTCNRLFQRIFKYLLNHNYDIGNSKAAKANHPGIRHMHVPILRILKQPSAVTQCFTHQPIPTIRPQRLPGFPAQNNLFLPQPKKEGKKGIEPKR